MSVALACAAWLALGLPCAAVFWRRGRRELGVALVPFAGALALTLPLALSPWLGGSISHWPLRAAIAALALAPCAQALLRGAPGRVETADTRGGALAFALLAAVSLGLVLAGRALDAEGWPGYGWDGLSIWLVRAKVLARSAELPAALFRERQLVQGHWDYPLLLPALLAWFARVGGLELRELALALGIVAACFAPALALGLRRALPAPIAAALAVAPFAVPGLVVTHFGAYADPLLVLVALAGFAWSAAGAIRQDTALVAAGALALACAVATKNEGALWLLAATTGAIALARAAGSSLASALATGARCALPGVVVFAAWRATCARLGVADTLPAELRFDLLGARAGELFAALRSFFGEPQRAIALGACAVATLALAGGGLRTRAARAAALLAAPAVYLGGLSLVYLATPHELAWHLVTSLPRTLFGLAPACLAAALLGPTLAHARSTEPDSARSLP
ncbi:MAG TPA: hypothetical protein VMW19_16650 [Myxococcota bacterium]|nr:hypothetical protein [Myxococcota bacterium]